MSKRIVRIKIDVTKIDKTALFTGAKGTYLDARLFLDDEPDQYDNNGPIYQDLGKARRDKGEKGAILGNAKIVRVERDHYAQQDAHNTAKADGYQPDNSANDAGFDDIPFAPKHSFAP